MAYTAKPSSLPTWGAAAASSTVVGSLDIDTVEYQSLTGNGAKIRYTFNGSPDLSSVATTHDLTVSGSSNSVNDGTFRILAVSDASDYIDVYNPQRTSASDDEATDATGTGTVVQNAARIVTPTTGRQNTGWRSPEKPNDALDNWFKNTTYNWLNQYDQNTDGDYLIGRRLTAGSGISLTDNGDNTQLITASGTNFKTFSAAEDWPAASGLVGAHLAEIRVEAGSMTAGAIEVVINGSVAQTINPSGSYDGFIDVTNSIAINAVHTYDDFSACNGATGNDLDYSGQSTDNPADVWIDSTNTRMYVLTSNGDVLQYTIDPNDPDGATTYVGMKAFGADYNKGIALSADGATLLLGYASGPTNRIYEYPFNTNWDITDVGSSVDNFGFVDYNRGLALVDGDTKIFYIQNDEELARIDLSSAADLTGAADSGSVYDLTADGITITKGLDVSSDGNIIYVLGGSEVIHKLDFGTAFNHTTLSYDEGLDVNSDLTASAAGMALSKDSDQRFIYVGDASFAVEQFDRREDWAGTARARVLYGVDG